jgi:hypothetical protein
MAGGVTQAVRTLLSSNPSDAKKKKFVWSRLLNMLRKTGTMSVPLRDAASDPQGWTTRQTRSPTAPDGDLGPQKTSTNNSQDLLTQIPKDEKVPNLGIHHVLSQN